MQKSLNSSISRDAVMEKGEELFRDFGVGKEEKRSRGKSMDDDDIIIRINKRSVHLWVERAIYYLIIIILLYFVFFNPFSDCDGVGKKKNETKAVVEPSVTSDKPKVEAKTEAVKKEEPKNATPPTPPPAPVVIAPVTGSGNATITITEVKLSETITIGETANTTSHKIDYVLVTIFNDRSLFTPSIKLFFWVDSTEAAIKAKEDAEFAIPKIPVGQTKAWKISDELLGKRLNDVPADTKAYFKVELLDSANNATIHSAEKIVSLQ